MVKVLKYNFFIVAKVEDDIIMTLILFRVNQDFFYDAIARYLQSLLLLMRLEMVLKAF